MHFQDQSYGKYHYLRQAMHKSKSVTLWLHECKLIVNDCSSDKYNRNGL